jgi:hypothetical protein
MNLIPMNLDYKELFKGLNRAGIDYQVVGGRAVNFHGIPRMTYDLDFDAPAGTGQYPQNDRQVEKMGLPAPSAGRSSGVG